MGYGFISAIAKHDPLHIYFSGRNTESANKLIERIQTSTPSARLTFIGCDLMALESVQAAAKRFVSISDRLDILVCNAGIMAVDAGTTEDGVEIQFGVNHLGHALLIKLFLPLMLQTAQTSNSDVRIVNMSSIAYQQAPKIGIDFATLHSDQSLLGNVIKPGHKWSRYGQSKLANMLYAQELARRYPSITSVAVHPGFVMTGIYDNVPLFTRLPALLLAMGKTIPPEQGPNNQLWAATCDKTKLVNGEYYEPFGKIGKRTTTAARDERLAEQLWDWTEKELEAYKPISACGSEAKETSASI